VLGSDWRPDSPVRLTAALALCEHSLWRGSWRARLPKCLLTVVRWIGDPQLPSLTTLGLSNPSNNWFPVSVRPEDELVHEIPSVPVPYWSETRWFDRSTKALRQDAQSLRPEERRV
jgi:hypothetical protein